MGGNASRWLLRAVSRLQKSVNGGGLRALLHAYSKSVQNGCRFRAWCAVAVVLITIIATTTAATTNCNHYMILLHVRHVDPTVAPYDILYPQLASAKLKCTPRLTPSTVMY